LKKTFPPAPPGVRQPLIPREPLPPPDGGEELYEIPNGETEGHEPQVKKIVFIILIFLKFYYITSIDYSIL